ncbi:MAG: biotin/lipoyl-binding protein [Planctomycetaceae bacterium]|nr:biotin/lipoyl-binding protein [Planctomycetaceae bacterium]
MRVPLIPLISVAALIFAAYHVSHSQAPPQKAVPPIEPARSPFPETVAGSGVVESRSENIELATDVAGVVHKLWVHEGERVGVGQLLISLDARDVEADLAVQETMLKNSQAEWNRLKAMPRQEEIPSLAAAVNQAKATVRKRQDAYERQQRLNRDGIGTDEELVSARSDLEEAQAAQEQAEAAHRLLLAGAWDQDLAIAQSQIQQMEAQLEKYRVELSRHELRAPVSEFFLEDESQKEVWEVLKINRRPGEFIGTPPSEAVIILGDTGPRRIRVDIDEHDLPRFQSGRPAMAYPRGASNLTYPLKFIRVEPYVIPKQSLTGDNADRVDTRVLQVIYEFEDPQVSVYVGQQMDVFIDLSNTSSGSNGQSAEPKSGPTESPASST